MKYIKQMGIILAISFVGELLHHFLPLPIPASIYGLALMLLMLQTKLLRLHAVRETGKFLVEIMPIMFVPAMVGLVDDWHYLKPIWLLFPIVVVVVTILVMLVSAAVTQLVIRWEKKRDE
ncbi:MAG: CidA/LrgA family protein [Oscillospiraceae bacterium]|nr:CidA/LrgA family protein [Oscillospiraceae bacterium]